MLLCFLPLVLILTDFDSNLTNAVYQPVLLQSSVF